MLNTAVQSLQSKGSSLPSSRQTQFPGSQIFGQLPQIGTNPADASLTLSSAMNLDPVAPLSSRLSSVASPAGVNSRASMKKPSVIKNKSLEAGDSLPITPSKKQRVYGVFEDQSIEQLNDVTAISGVNLQEEGEKLFPGAAESSRASEASRRVVREEEEKVIFHRTSLQKKLAKIMFKCGLKSISNDVEQCLSLCVEERLRGLVCNLIRLSNKRADTEKPEHQTFITSDVRHEISMVNKKVREEWERKQAEEKLQNVDEPEEDSAGDGHSETDGVPVKSLKALGSGRANREENDKLRATAATFAARAAVGGDDMLSKWQRMAEQARQKRQEMVDTETVTQSDKDIKPDSLSTSGRRTKDHQEPEKRDSPDHAGVSINCGRNLGASQTVVGHTITIKDVIAALEKEPQMSKSVLLYRLYERIQAEASAG